MSAQVIAALESEIQDLMQTITTLRAENERLQTIIKDLADNHLGPAAAKALLEVASML